MAGIKTKPNKWHPIRISESLELETRQAAELEQSNVSDYIRGAVEERNYRVIKGKSDGGKTNEACN